MRKLVIGIVLALVLIASAVPLTAAKAQTAKPLDNVVISPVTATVPVGGTKQFTAVGRDANNVTVDNVSYTWAVVAGGGTINSTGLFTAGNTPGTYPNTVQVTAVKDGIVRTANATVIIKAVGKKEFHEPPGWSHGKKTGWHNEGKPPAWLKTRAR